MTWTKWSAARWSAGGWKDNPLKITLDTFFLRGEDRLTVRLVHLAESGWRWVEFEGCRNTVEAVVDKVNHLLEMRQTPARKQRKDYLENKEKKKGRSRLSSKI